MSTTTGARGEGYLDAENQQHPILFTNRALAEAERALGRTTLDLVSQASASNLGLNDTARLLAIGLEHSRRDRGDKRRPYTMDDAWTLMDEYGFAAVVAVVFQALAAVLAYKRDSSAALIIDPQ